MGKFKELATGLQKATVLDLLYTAIKDDTAKEMIETGELDNPEIDFYKADDVELLLVENARLRNLLNDIRNSADIINHPIVYCEQWFNEYSATLESIFKMTHEYLEDGDERRTID